MNTTITLTGGVTATGATTGAETFLLTGGANTVLLAGAADTVDVTTGGQDRIDLNATGFSHATVDSINLGASAGNRVFASHALTGADITISGGAGANRVALTNHGGTTTIALTGAAPPPPGQFWQTPGPSVWLNGDASNIVSITGAGGAEIAIGKPGDGDTGDTARLDVAGAGNHVLGGDEAFTVTAEDADNTVFLGAGNNTLSLAGVGDQVALGSGDNDITLGGGGRLVLEMGGAGARDQITLGSITTQTGGWFSQGDQIIGGNENVLLVGPAGSAANVLLGNGDDSIMLGTGRVSLGLSAANTATDQVALLQGGSQLVLNGGTDTALLAGKGGDQVLLNGTRLGTALAAAGSFDSITLAADANAAIAEASGAGGLHLTVLGDAAGGLGEITINGLAQDKLASIDLVGTGSYTVAHAAGGITLDFAHGSIELAGLTALPPGLLTETPSG